MKVIWNVAVSMGEFAKGYTEHGNGVVQPHYIQAPKWA